MVRPSHFLLVLMLWIMPAAAVAQCVNGQCTVPSTNVTVNLGGDRNIRRYPMVCRIAVQESGGMRSLGSGVYAVSPEGSQPCVLTAWHVVKDNPTSPIVIYFPATKTSYWGRVYQKNTRDDLVSVLINKTPQGIRPMPVSTTAPTVGVTVNLAGCGNSLGRPRRGFLAWRARCVNRCGYDSSPIQTAIEIDRPCSQGDSGGPCWDARGQLIGIITSGNATTTIVTTGVAKKRCGLLHRLFPRRGNRAKTQVHVSSQYEAPVVDSVPAIPPDTSEAPPAPTPAEPIEAPTGSIDYDRIIAGVYAQLQANPGPFRGPAGSPGPPGDPGRDAELTPDHLAALTLAAVEQLKADAEFLQATKGDKGDKGDPPTIDVQAIAAAIQQALPPLTVRTVNGDGLVMDSEQVPLGGTLNLHHQPMRQ